MTYADGTVKKGLWKDDKYIGPLDEDCDSNRD